jgi:antitoxin PrlF
MKNAKMVRVSSKGQVVLPKSFREKIGIAEGDYLMIQELADGLLVLGKSRSEIFDAIAEPIRREAEEQGITPDDIMDFIKEMRKERHSNAA